MALVLADRIKETTTTTGTGTVTLLGASSGFQSFAVVGNANTTYYAIVGQTTTEWEVGLGTYTASGTTLSRTTVYASSNANALVTFSAGTKDVFVTLPSSVTVTSGGTPSFATLNLTGTTNQVSSVAVSSDPAAPSAGNLKTFARTIAGGYTAPAFLNATNAAVQLQPAFANKKIAMYQPIWGSATPTTFGLQTTTSLGAASNSATTTNLFSRAVRLNYTSAGTAGALGYFYQGSSAYLSLGTATAYGGGGFYYVIRFGIADAVTSPRTFVGMTSSTGVPTNVEPSTLTNCIGVGQGAANTNLFIYYGGSAAQTPIDLGTNFPTNTNAVDWYEFTLFAPPTSANTVYYQVTRLNTGNVTTGTLTGTAGTVLPANSTLLTTRLWRCNNATASAVSIAFGGMYIETDY